jgi:uncharacterized membrane protein YbjE (DUF340 family)
MGLFFFLNRLSQINIELNISVAISLVRVRVRVSAYLKLNTNVYFLYFFEIVLTMSMIGVQLFENTIKVKLNILNENIYIKAFIFLLIDTVVSPIASYSFQNNTTWS